MRNYAIIFLFALAFAVSVPTEGQSDNFSKLKSIVKQALDTLVSKLDELIKKRSNSSAIIGRIVGKGYEHFSQSSTLNKLTGLQRGSFDMFVDIIIQRFGLAPKDKEEIRQKVFGKLRDDTEPGKWVEHKMLFNPENDPNNTKYICIYGIVRENRNFDIAILEIKSSFKLAKNLLIIQNKSTGKITLEPEKLETERVPPGVKKDDIQVLLKFFEATALRILHSKI